MERPDERKNPGQLQVTAFLYGRNGVLHLPGSFDSQLFYYITNIMCKSFGGGFTRRIHFKRKLEKKGIAAYGMNP